MKAGKYGLYTIPRADEWTIVLSSQNDLWGAGGYDPASDVARFEVEVETLGAVHETLSIEMQGFHANGADMTIAWERTRVRFPVRVDSDTRVLQEIDEKVRKAKGEVSSRTYFDAGMYLYEKQENLEEAEAWIDRAVELEAGRVVADLLQGQARPSPRQAREGHGRRASRARRSGGLAAG